MPSAVDGQTRLQSSTSSQSFSVTLAPPVELEDSQNIPYPPRFEISSDHDRQNPVKQSTLPIPNASFNSELDRRRSYDDGVRPLNVLFGRKDEPSPQPSDVPTSQPSLTVTSRRDKRRSINPGISLSELVPPMDTAPLVDRDMLTARESPNLTSRRDKRRSINPGISPTDFTPSLDTSGTSLLPHSTSMNGYASSDHTSVPLSPGGRSSPHAPSPLRDYFNPIPKSPSSSRPTSHGSSHLSHSTRSSSTSLRYSEEHWQNQSRQSSPTKNLNDESQDQTIVVKSTPSSTITLGSVPPLKSRSKAEDSIPSTVLSSDGGHDRSSASLGPSHYETSHSKRSYDRRPPSSRSDSGSLSLHSPIRSRSISPGHRVDVPSGVESETDTDGEIESSGRLKTKEDHVLPVPPPKEEKHLLQSAATEGDLDTSLVSPDSDDLSESSPVERTSHSTFIAPALPPIRISMNTADFSELLNSVGGFPSLKSLDHMARISEGNGGEEFTPPPTANLDNLTPKSNSTMIPLIHNGITLEQTQRDHPDHSVDQFESQATEAPALPPKPGKAPGVFSRPEGLDSSITSHVSSSSAPVKVENPMTNGIHHSLENSASSTRITLTEPESVSAKILNGDTGEIVMMRLQEALADTKERGAHQLKMDRSFVEAILSTMESKKAEYQQLRSRFDGVKVCQLFLSKLYPH